MKPYSKGFKWDRRGKFDSVGNLQAAQAWVDVLRFFGSESASRLMQMIESEREEQQGAVEMDLIELLKNSHLEIDHHEHSNTE